MPWRTGWKKYFAYSLAVAFVFVYLKGVASLPVHSGERATEKYLMGACEREWMSLVCWSGRRSGESEGGSD